MRVIIGGSSLAVLLALIIVIHTSVINKSVREDEINRGLENATDYAIDVCITIISANKTASELPPIITLIQISFLSFTFYKTF